MKDNYTLATTICILQFKFSPPVHLMQSTAAVCRLTSGHGLRMINLVMGQLGDGGDRSREILPPVLCFGQILKFYVDAADLKRDGV